jgi:hypothetical protein
LSAITALLRGDRSLARRLLAICRHTNSSMLIPAPESPAHGGVTARISDPNRIAPIRQALKVVALLQSRRRSRILSPHPFRDVLFLRADGIDIDGGRAELGVTKPFLHQVEGRASVVS